MINISLDVLGKVSHEVANTYKVVPCEEQNDKLILYSVGNSNREGIKEELEFVLGYKIGFKTVNETEINSLLEKYYSSENPGSSRDMDSVNIDIVDELLNDAIEQNASDIHFEPYQSTVRIRFRVDGKLLVKREMRKTEYSFVINKIKIRAKLDISEKRLPQDGRILGSNLSEDFDVRVSVMPGFFGEKIVMRILRRDATQLSLNKLGLSAVQSEHYLKGVGRQSGIILISGPTGSGKTTTLYATLKELNKESVNILTVEDPIEYTLEGINQTQLNESIGLTFGKALRTFLRQDPDIIMLGEIRDSDTATMAVRAALTGHLVFSTVHTNSAWGILGRLSDMGIPSFLVGSTLNIAVAQRLVRKLCDKCKKEIPISEDEKYRLVKTYGGVRNHFVPVGCEACLYTGYKGRIAIYEVIPIDEHLENMIRDNHFEYPKEYLKKIGVKSLAENAIAVFKKGLTSFDEIIYLIN